LDETTIPYHLAIPTIMCVVGLVAILVHHKKLFNKNGLLWSSVTVFIVLYALIVGSAAYNDIYYQWDLNRYDLDKDGFFGGQEITKEQEVAMNRQIHDVGRNFSFMTGFIFAGIISTFIYVLGKLILIARNKKRLTD
jgi:hypothetical protein